MSVMKCARNRTTCARSVVQCYASGDVRCGIVLSVVISICVIDLSVPVLFFHIVVLILLAVILSLFIQLFSRSHFSHMFSLYSLGILGVVLTPPVGYSRPPSAVNDPTVTKQVNSENHARISAPITSLSGFPDQSVLGTSSR